jgi:hypothetical protein
LLSKEKQEAAEKRAGASLATGVRLDASRGRLTKRAPSLQPTATPQKQYEKSQQKIEKRAKIKEGVKLSTAVLKGWSIWGKLQTKIATMTRLSARWQAKTDGFVPVDRYCSCYKQSLAGDDPTLALHIRRCETVLLRGDSTMREESLWRRHEGHRNDWRSVFDSWVCRKVAKAMRDASQSSRLCTCSG